MPYGRLQQGTQTAPNPSGLAVDVHLGTLQLQAAAPTGTALDLQLPFGTLTTRMLDERRSDPGLGDLELRVRQSAGRWVSRPQLALAIGAALPTGPDLQWRDGASEPDPFTGGRLASANAGGWQWTVSPAAVVELGGGVSASVGARIPLWSDVVGNQLVPQTGGFAAVSYAHRLEPRRSAPYRPPAGQITVVDYRATWCAPCVEISRQLDDAARRWTDVRIVRVDASRSGPRGASRRRARPAAR